MRLHRITLRHYRGVTEAEIVLPERGVTIVEGDNEVGKTSFAEALDLLFNFQDSSTHRRIKAIQPVHRDAGAEVEVEMSTGPYRFVYAKRWHRQRQTRLEVLAPQRRQLTGRDAHDRVEAMLEETVDPALWRVLRLQQGVALTQPSFDVSSLGHALDAAAGGDHAGDREDDLWARICEERERYWTPTGQPRGERVSLARSLEEAQGQLAEAEAKVADLEAATEEVAALSTAAEQLERDRAARALEEEGLAARVEAVERQRNEVARLASRADAARAVRDRLAAEAARRRELVTEVERWSRERAHLEAELERAQPLRSQTEQRHRAMVDELDRARAAADAAEVAHRRAAEDVDHRRREIELEQLNERHERVIDAQKQLTAAEEYLESARVDDDLVARIEAAHLEAARCEAVATTSAATVEITAPHDRRIVVEDQERNLIAGEPDTHTVTQDLRVVVPDVVEVMIRAGSEAQSRASELRRVNAQLGGLCEQGGVANLGEARARAAERRDAERQRALAAEAIARDLRDLTLESLTGKVQRVRERIETYRAERPADPPLPVDLDDAQRRLSEAEHQLEHARGERRSLEEQTAQAAAALKESEVADAGLAARLDQAERALGQASHSLQEARAARGDEEVLGDLESAERELAGIDQARATAEAALDAEDPNSLEALLENARAARVRATEELRENRERRQQLRVRLDLEGEQGLAQRLDDASSRVAHLEREVEQLEARAAAAKLLHETMAARRDEARRRYVAPFRDRIERLARLVFGPSLEVELDDDLRIARRTLDGVTVAFDQLSTGAQEQLGLIARLACAGIVAEDGGAPVIFDDALGWTDPRRLERMGAVIALAGRECQIIVLTCTPGRYASVGEASVVRLRG